MHNDNVYKYVLSSINSILEHGIDYYETEDEVLKSRLKDIYDFVNKGTKYNIEDKQSISITDDKNEDNILSNTKEIKALTDSFMNKITNIKISVLNLENELSPYYNEDTFSEGELIVEVDNLVETESNVNLEDTDIIVPVNTIETFNTESEDIEKIEDIDEISPSSSDEEQGGSNKSFFDIFKRRK